MKWETYKNEFVLAANQQMISADQQVKWLEYARNIQLRSLPIIFDQDHLALLLGIDSMYLYAMSNGSKSFYRTFYINKRNGKPREICEPLPDLKHVQHWILHELLENIHCSKYAKAYISGRSIKSNARFHRKQNVMISIDIKDFFPSIKLGRVLNVFIGFGYSVPVALMLANLCCLRNCLPQGAPTSPYLSNLVMKYFDNEIGLYCNKNKIRYTRYADDMTFSGDFNIGRLLNRVDTALKSLGLIRNIEKNKVMRSNNRQIVTGIVVNKKMQVPRKYRMKIRQEIYYIQKFGLDDHLLHIKEPHANYAQHLAGKIKFALFINPDDIKMKEALMVIKPYLQSKRGDI